MTLSTYVQHFTVIVYKSKYTQLIPFHNVNIIFDVLSIKTSNFIYNERVD
jgi:hypothetical protein